MKRNFGLALQRAQNTFNRNVDRYARTIGLTGTQMVIIQFLSAVPKEQKVYQRDIEHEFNIRKSTATNILKLLEQKDLIAKKADAHDSRLKEIMLTTKAIGIKRDAAAYVKRSEASVERILGKKLCAEVTQALLKLDQEL
ncbi:MarR family winged helix-turn-helix transcriptional regulator [Lactobacillus sp. ESL0679]|uniref:MarR family winged helix-turn-helix transcriptional regulator n=1 Tax=unclassified Lactobacillus TaxID=2620435 RepID=UPI0023F6B010|nr:MULTISPECIES: MarR family winged helix-turn-helix transcriptional regulator [unclassified Lactobacillus]MDF7683429.1 MarR family winged helix-turn-helix transcriptional regulator [Lactobacillus sp. ESL0679]WEV37624.1 MarR family winged helix-turn-helix transcriptional regulator [Lactobacillus sp. ESL0677]